MKRLVPIVLPALLVLYGCTTDETMNYDGVTTSAGDAMRANTVMQMVDPWPEGVQDTDLLVPADRGASSAGEPSGDDAYDG